MKKKLFATLIAGAVLSVGLVGITACGNGGNNSVNKGEEVDAEGWATAIAATLEAKNYKVGSYVELVIKANGAYEGIVEDFGAESVNMSIKSTANGTDYYDAEGVNLYYTNVTTKVKASGVPEKLKEEYSDGEHVAENYVVKEGNTYYTATYDGSEKEPKWEVNDAPYNYIGSPAYVLNRSFAAEKNGNAVALSELFKSFTYEKGVYCATLYRYEIEYKLSVSVKGGYVIGYSMETSESEEKEGFTSSDSIKYVYNFSGFGSTTVTPSDAAKNAVEEYKAK